MDKLLETPVPVSPAALPSSSSSLISESDLSPTAQDCVEALASLALALGVDSPAPAPLAAAAAAALAGQQAAQDEAEQLYELVQKLEAQVAAASTALDSLKALEARMDAEAPARAAEAVENRESAVRRSENAQRYKEQAAQKQEGLRQQGLTDELRHASLEALSREAAAAAAECEAVEQELAQFVGLPPDLAAARAVHSEAQARLEQMRAKIAAGVEGLAG